MLLVRQEALLTQQNTFYGSMENTTTLWLQQHCGCNNTVVDATTCAVVAARTERKSVGRISRYIYIYI